MEWLKDLKREIINRLFEWFYNEPKAHIEHHQKYGDYQNVLDKDNKDN